MSDENAARPPSAQELRRMLDDLAREGEQLRAKALEPAPDLRELMGLPSAGAVTFTRDERGLIDGVTFEHIDGARPEPEALLVQLNLALFSGASVPRGLGNVVTESADLAPGILAFMAAVEGAEEPEPVVVTNDLKTVTISALFGEVVAIDCSPSFLLAANDDTLAAEIVRVARDASIASDVLGKYTEGSNS